MAEYHRAYNYASFRFTEEDAETAFWSRQAPALGHAAPDFALPTIGGDRWALADHRGRPVVIEFGSYTCPIFCGHASAMEQLAEQHPEASFVVIYVREAHPGEVTPAHATDGEKREAAGRLVETEGLRRTVLLDTLDGSVHLRYGGGYDGVFVLDPEGHIVVRRFWNEPSDVRTALLAMREGRRPIPVESLRFGWPSQRGPEGAEMLERGGVRAVRDFADGAPPRIARRLEASTPGVRAALGEDAPLRT